MYMVIRFIAVSVISFYVGRVVKENKENQRLENAINMSNKHFSMFLLMNKWVQNKSENKDISSYFINKKINTIAIYGMNYIGNTLYVDLKNTPIKVEYAIDSNAECMYAECELYTLQDSLRKVDAVIVTPLIGFDEIKEQIAKKMDCKIISIEEIIYGL